LPPLAQRYRERLYFAKIISAGRDGAIRAGLAWWRWLRMGPAIKRF